MNTTIWIFAIMSCCDALFNLIHQVCVVFRWNVKFADFTCLTLNLLRIECTTKYSEKIPIFHLMHKSKENIFIWNFHVDCNFFFLSLYQLSLPLPDHPNKQMSRTSRACDVLNVRFSIPPSFSDCQVDSYHSLFFVVSFVETQTNWM